MTPVAIGGEFQKRRPKRIKSFPQSDAEDQPIDIFNGQWPEQQGVDRAEDCRVRADAESQRRDCDRGQTGLPKQDPRAITQIVPKRVHKQLLVTQRFYWIELGGGAGRQITRQQTDNQ